MPCLINNATEVAASSFDVIPKKKRPKNTKTQFLAGCVVIRFLLLQQIRRRYLVTQQTPEKFPTLAGIAIGATF